MSDKEKIKQEIESYKESIKGLEPHSDFRRGQLTAYNQIMQFIDSLPEEPASEDLKKEISKWRNHYLSVLDNNLRIDLRDIEVTANHFAEWGRNHFEDKSEMVSEDLEEEINKYITGNPAFADEPIPRNLFDYCIIAAAHHFAEWQKKKDQQTIELVEDHAMLAGMNKMKEEMMKDAVEAEVFIDYNINFGYGSLTANIDLDEQHLKEGDKVKIIIVKEEQ